MSKVSPFSKPPSPGLRCRSAQSRAGYISDLSGALKGRNNGQNVPHDAHSQLAHWPTSTSQSSLARHKRSANACQKTDRCHLRAPEYSVQALQTGKISIWWHDSDKVEIQRVTYALAALHSLIFMRGRIQEEELSTRSHNRMMAMVQSRDGAGP